MTELGGNEKRKLLVRNESRQLVRKYDNKLPQDRLDKSYDILHKIRRGSKKGKFRIQGGNCVVECIWLVNKLKFCFLPTDVSMS